MDSYTIDSWWGRGELADGRILPIDERLVVLEADYPHCDSTWPHTQSTIHEQIVGLQESVIKKVTSENAARLYQHPGPVAGQDDPDAY